MKLNLRQLFEIVGEKKEFTCSFDFSGDRKSVGRERV